MHLVLSPQKLVNRTRNIKKRNKSDLLLEVTIGVVTVATSELHHLSL